MRWSVLRGLIYAVLLGCGGPSYGAPAYAEPEAEREGARSAARRDSAGAPAAGVASSPAAQSEQAQGPHPDVRPSAEASAPSAAVFVNGQMLADPDLRELEARLGQAPEPGRYWYDEKSGLWGLMGHGAGGVTKVGLRAGPLPSDASLDTSGVTTGVLINGREITRAELSVLARLLAWEEPQRGQYAGRYTLDENGELYGPANRFLGNLIRAAARAQGSGAVKDECAWMHLKAKDDSFGRAVTVACD